MLSHAAAGNATLAVINDGTAYADQSQFDRTVVDLDLNTIRQTIGFTIPHHTLALGAPITMGCAVMSADVIARFHPDASYICTRAIGIRGLYASTTSRQIENDVVSRRCLFHRDKYL